RSGHTSLECWSGFWYRQGWGEEMILVTPYVRSGHTPLECWSGCLCRRAWGEEMIPVTPHV
ncbi:hypothetical protein NDU88_003680, partial [Pleurodeles waltl]